MSINGIMTNQNTIGFTAGIRPGLSTKYAERSLARLIRQAAKDTLLADSLKTVSERVGLSVQGTKDSVVCHFHQAISHPPAG